MNMKKTIGVCATLLAALLCAVPQSARATGKIRRIDAEDPNNVYSFPNFGNALKVGDKVQIRFHMANINWDNTWSSSDDYTNPWMFTYTKLTGNETMDQLNQIASKRPRHGLWISGGLREAECVNFPLGNASDWLMEKVDGKRYFTDLVFEYEVQPGDIALPIQLANEKGDGPANRERSTYYLKFGGEKTNWEMVDSRTMSVTNEFKFGPADLRTDPDFAGQTLTDWLGVVWEYERYDLDLTQAGVYVQALDFDSTYADEAAGIWRTISKGAVTADPGAPTLSIPGGASTTMDLYIWTGDTNIAEVVKGGQLSEVRPYEFSDGITRIVGKIRVNATDTSVPFYVKATGETNKTTQVFLAATPTNIFNAAGDVITNFISRTVKVGEPLPPSINVTVNGKTTEKVTANADYATALVSVNVTLSEAYPVGEFTIPLKVSVKEKPALSARDYVGMSQSSVDDNTAWDTVLTIPNGQTSANMSLWMYANRGTVDTESNGLLVEVDTNAMDTAARAFFTGKILPATVVVNRSTPDVTSALPPITDVEANSPKEVTINVADAYGELRDPCRYTVYWSRSGGVSASDYVVIPDLAATVLGDLTFSVTYLQKGDYTSRFYVENQDGKKSTNVSVSVSVKAQKVVEATTLQKKFPEDAFNDQEIVTLNFGAEGFSMPNGETEGYVFFVPRNANASNLVECSDLNIDDEHRWMAGYPVYAGETEVGPFLMTLYDGDSRGITMGYDVIVRTAERWDEGTTVTSWNSKGFSFGVTNVVPEVTQVSMSGTRLKANGGTMGAHASLGVSKTFTAQTTEPSDLDLYADEANNYQNDQKAFATEWSFDYGTGTPDVRYVYGPPSTVLSYAFTQAGNCTVTVRMCDKDMDHNRDVWGPEFTFTVVVDEKPAISLSAHYGTGAFTENEAGEPSQIDVGLTLVPSEEITVQLSVERADPSWTGSEADYPLPVLSTYSINFGGDSPNTTSAKFNIKSMDGTRLTREDGFVIRAAVVSPGENEDGVAWSNLYRRAEMDITIANVPPEITIDPGTNVVERAINTPFDIDYEFKDNLIDMKAGETLKWTITGEASTNYVVTSTSASTDGKFTTMFTSSGTKTVQLQVVDKDRGQSAVVVWHYLVKSSKKVVVYPRQPNLDVRGADGVSTLSMKWTGADGIGDGRVWADEAGSMTQFSDFKHVYSYAPSVPTAYVYAHGYKNGDVDDGTLGPGHDWAITKNGSYPASGDYYESKEPSGLDSFFYAWLLTSSGDKGGSGETTVLKLAPAYGVYSTSEQPVTLPEEEKDTSNSAESYPDTILEAIFAKEYIPSDNLGDINQDGIPDIYAVQTAWGSGAGSGTLLEIAGGTPDDAGDVKIKFNSYNDDSDYLPSREVSEGRVPSVEDGWTTLSVPFSAIMEIRGFHEGLNHRTRNDGLNKYVRGTWVSEPCFSEAETNAVAYWNGLQTWADFKKEHAEDEDEAYATALAEWQALFDAKLREDTSWIPEKRTDPTLWDTDDDTFPDAYEYFFWYRAAVGWMEGDEWKQLTGSRFRLEDISEGEEITPEEIMAAFDPTVKAEGVISERDTDNDGLTDLEELALGTNPVHWDTDGDGMSDLWEVMRGMNPLKVPEPTAKELNLDQDYMAAYETERTYAVLTFKTGDGKTVSYAVDGNGAAYLSDGALADGVSNITAIAVYRYGGAGTTQYTPISRGAYDRDNSISYLGQKGRKRTCASKVKAEETWGSIFVATAKPLDTAEVDISELTFVSAERNASLLLVHDQVYAQFGFDPRTGWNLNINGYASSRWDPVNNKPHADMVGEAGRAVNTWRYDNLDEFLVLKYRYMARAADTGMPLRNVNDDLAKIASKELTLAGVFDKGTTNPNTPFEKTDFNVSWTPVGKSQEAGADQTQGTANLPTFTGKNHGADTDEDGVPDGWELYVRYDPNNKRDGTLTQVIDGYYRCLATEYAGTDSCNAYSNAVSYVVEEGASESAAGTPTATIYENHPGNKSGWFNKFFPTDPWSVDTDGDGLSDNDEGSAWSDDFVYAGWTDKGVGSHTYTFIYGDPVDDGSLCIRGGGLNPCSVDTDFDLIPDPWEHDFAGVVFMAGRPWKSGDSKYGTSLDLDDGIVDAINRNDGINTASGAVRVAACYITAGMDGTFGPRKDVTSIVGDAVTSYDQIDPRTGTKRNFDFDNDGLQNFQEYLVQSLRHLRFDDTETPLMGSYLPDGLDGTRKYVKFLPMQTWDGAAFYETAREAGFTGLSAYGGAKGRREGFRYGELGYFSRPPKPWDPLALIEDGKNCNNYSEAGFRVMLRPAGLSKEAAAENEDRLLSKSYVSTDPRQWDSDGDGMDDYYELFHGLNPLLGKTDVIRDAYSKSKDDDAFLVTSLFNAWVGWPTLPPMLEPEYDAMKYPWFMGVAEADADGDGLRNTDEALLVNTPSPQNYHTDPTPLWMTDSSAKTSFTSQYYGRDPYVTAAMGIPDLTHYFWFDQKPYKVDDTYKSQTADYMFSFEENEGYDSDHDWLPDSHELTSTVLAYTDPQNTLDPDRRQGVYLPGEEEKGALISVSGNFNRPVGENYAMLRQFTVEAWIRPEDVTRAQTIVTRVCDYPGGTLSNAVHQLRANFRIGINDQGLLYGQYDTDDAVPSASDFGTTTVLGVPAEAGVWTHVALAFNGSALILYVNGSEVKRAPSSLIPANGLVLTQQAISPAGAYFGEDGYTVCPSRLIVGADAAAVEAIQLDAMSSWDNYGSFYKGWIDEVRVWDGARTSAQIVSDYKKRYLLSDLAALRDEVYAVWANGGSHNSNDGRPDLPAELLLHYNFQQLPGEVASDYVAGEPSGFTEKVIDNVKWNGHSVDLSCGWWAALPLASTVYGNRAYVPWVRNACGVLPALDGSTPDSRYWSELLGGVTFPVEVGVSAFAFPNAACPYAYWNFMGENYFRNELAKQLMDCVGSGFQTIARNVRDRVMFEQRSGFMGGADLVPLGGAYAKRCVDFWDDLGAMDAWTATGDDLDNDDLPDWWEALYGDPDEITPTFLITYEGQEMEAREAYLRDLAKGLLPGGSLDDLPSEYASKTDRNNNDIPDWWESIYGLSPAGAWSDSDGDQLSDYAEWLIGMGFAPTNPSFPYVSPLKACSLQGQIVPDYFLRVDNHYLGGMFTDHDFIEDAWEMNFLGDAATGVYDAYRDDDQDGWSNFAECRAGTSPSAIAYLGVDEMSVPDYPVPTVRVTAKYNGTRDVAGATTYVQAWRADDTSGRPDAAWLVTSSGSVSSEAQTGTSSAQGGAKKVSNAHAKLIGMNPNREIMLTLGPGSVTPGSVVFAFKDIAWKRVNSYVRNGAEAVLSTSLGDAADAVWLKCAIDRSRDATWGDLVMVSTNGATGAINNEGTVGEINYHTGAVVIDLSKMQGEAMYDREMTALSSGGGNESAYVTYSLVDLAKSQVKVDWSSKFAAQGFPQTYYLSDSATAEDGVSSRGRLREGKNIFAAFIDLDDSGTWTPGEPYGAVANVDVGWSGTSCEIEMMDTTPQMVRIDLATAIPAQNFENADAATDRSQVNIKSGFYKNEKSDYPASNTLANVESRTKVRVVRKWINDEAAGGAYYAVVLERDIDLSVHPCLTEVDLLASGVYDLDWGTLLKAYGGGVGTLESARYRIVIGEGSLNPLGRGDNNLPVEFVNRFETRARQTPTVPDPHLSEIVYAGQPTFRWSHTNSIDKAYPAFQLKIYAQDKTTVVYDSGVQQAPSRNADGMYEWTAPVSAGMVTPQGKVFDAANTYYWAVSMLDAKFTSFNSNEVKTPFRLSTTGNISDVNSYGSIKVAVKYFGPLVGSLSTSAATLKNLVHVQAFTTPDFTGQPVGEAYVTNVADVASISNITVNAIIRGVQPGTYYVRAYVDTDGNFQKDDWETWGYGCYVGDAGAPFITIGRGNLKSDVVSAANFPYTPRGYKVAKNAEVPTATIYMEDADTDGDAFPDSWEMQTYGSLVAQSPITGDTFFATVNPNLLSSLSAYSLERSVASSTAHLGITLMGVLLNGSGNAAAMAASLLSDGAAEETTAVQIKSFSFEDGLDLEIKNVSAADTAGVLTFNDTAEVRLYLLGASSPDFADAVEVPVKNGPITIRANDTVVEAVSAEELAAARAQMPDARFFKAVIKK